MDNIQSSYNQSSNALTQKIVSWAMSFANKVPNQNIQPNYRPNISTSNSTPAMKFPTLNTSLKQLWQLTTGYWDSTRYEWFHPGIDIANKIGTPIPSISQGVVTKVEHNKSWFGNSVIISDPQGNQVRYSHLKQAYVQPWQKLTKWMEIWLMGNTGSTYSNSGGTWSHLDLRIMNAYKKYINPFTYLKQNG